MSLSAIFIKHPIGTSLLAGGLALAGLICFLLLGISALPQLDFPAISVSASEPGADPSTMAATVASPLERHLGQIVGVDSMDSHSTEGNTSIVLIFNSGTDLNAAARAVQAAINAAAVDLPAGLPSPPTYHEINPNDDPIIQFALTSDTYPMASLFDTVQTVLQPRMSQLPGVASVEISGSAAPAIRADVDLRKLESLGLSTNDLRNALTAANVISPQGSLSDDQTQMAVNANDQLHTPQDFAGLVIASHNGQPIFLRDVARVYRGAQDRYQVAWLNNKHSVQIDVYKQADANVIDTVDTIKAELANLRAELPAGTQLTPFFDRTPTIRASVNDIETTLLISLGMVTLMIALFLRRLAPTLIAATAIPLSLAGTFVVMYVLHFTLDNLSLLALVIAVGFVLDDAIVVIENIIRHIDEGEDRRQAALDGAREIGFTIVAITLSLIAVFIPLLFAPGMIGLFFHEFTLTLIAAIVMSAIVSLTLTPSLCGMFLAPPSEPKPSRLSRALDQAHATMHALYVHALDWTLRRAWLLALTPLLLMVGTYVLFGQIKAGLFPLQDSGLIVGGVDGGPGSGLSFAQLEQRQERLTAVLMADPAVAEVGASLGSSLRGPNGSYHIQLKPLGKGRSESTQDVATRLTAEALRFPGLNLHLRVHEDLPSGPGGGNPALQYHLTLASSNLDEMRTWLPRLLAQIKTDPMFSDADSDVNRGALLQTMVVNRDAASRLGVSPAAVDDALYNAFGQRQISTIYSDTNQYAVVLTALPSESATPHALNDIRIRSSRGEMVPLAAVAHQAPSLASDHVDHEAQLPVMHLDFNLAPGVSISQAIMEVQKTIADMRMPGDIKLSYGDQFRRFQQQNDMPLLLLGAVLAIYIVLGMLYESLVHPVTILSTLPSAGVGALLALLITGTELSIIAMMALVLLIGLVKKNAIMMVDFALAAQRDGARPLDAIREACLVRFRPIVMTTMVAILASLPLAVGIGTGAELRRPLGIAMLGGLIVSQCLTLLSTPALYLVFARWYERHKQSRNQPHDLRRSSEGI